MDENESQVGEQNEESQRKKSGLTDKKRREQTSNMRQSKDKVSKKEESSQTETKKAGKKEKPKVERKKGKEHKDKPEKKTKEETGQPSLEEEIEISESMKTIIDSIEKMNVMELSNLVKLLEKKFGVSAVPAMVPSAVSGGGEPATEEEEKDTFNVILSDIGSQKIQVIKEIRGITTLGLKEAKDLVESVPKSIKEDIPKQEAEEIKKKLESVGAKVELK